MNSYSPFPYAASRPARSFRYAALVCLLASSAWAQGSSELEAGFSQPPNSAKPQVFWFWTSGNVSAEGITADLEAMQRIGLGGTLNFTIDTVDTKGPVKYMSPEWRSLVQHTIKESERLGLDYSLANCEGWTTSGGPWVTLEQSMQQVVWNEMHVTGGKTVELDVTRPSALRGYYKDIGLFAFPSMSNDLERQPDRIRTSTGAEWTRASAPYADYLVELPGPKPEGDQWVDFTYDEPVTCSTFRIETDPKMRNYPARPWKLQITDDGKTFRDLAAFGPRTGTTGYTVTFPEERGSHFRLHIPAGTMRVPNYYVWYKTIKVLKLAMSGLRVDRAEARAAGISDRASNRFSDELFPAPNIIPREKIVDLTGKPEWNAPPGDWTLVRVGHTTTGAMQNPSPPESTGLECDKLSRNAVEAHFNAMLAKVIAEAGPLAGKALRNIHVDSWEVGAANWTPLMREEFQKRRGYDLWPWLAVLTGRVVGSADASERFLWDFRKTIGDLAADNHYGTFRELAQRHNMGLYAQAVGTKLPTVADQLQSKGRTDMPMGEFWLGKVPNEDTKEAASAAHIYGKKFAGAEAYTSQLPFAHWTNDPYSMKAMGDLHFTRGINLFVLNGSAHQPEREVPKKPGMTWGRWGINFERTNTWWEPGAAWMSYLARCQFLLQQGLFVADLCYLYRDGAPSGLEVEPLEPQLPAGFDYDACNAEVVLTRMNVVDGRIVLPDGMQYRVLVLSPTDRMSLPVLRRIRDLVKAGATIMGPKPTKSPSLAGYPESDSMLQEIANEVWGKCDGKVVTEHRYGAGRIVWGRPLRDALGVAPDFESANRDLLYIHRRAGDTDIYFVSNQQARAMVVDCTFRVSGKAPELWHPDTGKIERVAMYSTKSGRTTLPLHLDPAGSMFVVFRPATGRMDPVVAMAKSREVFRNDGATAAYSAPLPMPPVIEQGKLTLTAWHAGDYTFITAGGAKLQANASDLPPPVEITTPWRVAFPPNHGAPPAYMFPRLASWTESMHVGVKYFSGTATYTTTFTLPADYPAENRRIYLDLGTVKHLAEISVNKKSFGVLWKEPFRIDVTDALKPGDNAFEIKVTNVLANRMIGDQRLPEKDRITWAAFNPFDPQSHPRVDTLPLPSGLLGPVLLRPAQLITARPASHAAK